MALGDWTRRLIVLTALAAVCGLEQRLTAGPGDALKMAEPSTENPVAEDASFGPEVAGDTVASVDIARYLGTWYEIASIPQIFQRDCTATRATYGLIDASTISVVNECSVGSLQGPERRAEGTATVEDTATRSKLLVSFGFGPPAPYWIVELGQAPELEPYPWAVVSNPDRSALWVLSRTRTMDRPLFTAILQRLERRGFEPARMILTPQ